MKRKETGDRGEKLAQDYLKKRHFHLLETNYHCPYGEIDIISKYKNMLVFTEVRSKTGTGFGTPEESITRTKRSRIRASAFHYIQNHDKLPQSWRIDVVAIEMDENGKTTRIELIENAVGEE
jgi:putative endonuclease